MNKTGKRRFLRLSLIVLFWLCVWQGASMAVDNSILLVGPADVFGSLSAQMTEPDFWATILHSFARISLGFLLAFSAGVLLGSLAFALPLPGEILSPVILLLKSIPVASFVILVLIWAGSGNLSVVIAFTVAFPMVYESTLSGLGSADKKLLEMAQVFRVGLFRRARFIYFPALMPYLAASCRTALGMSVKSGIAAEVIGIPDGTIGEKLYMAKIYLDTAGLFAWTFVIIVTAFVFERLFLRLLDWIAGRYA